MIYETITFAVDRDIATLTLNRPDVMNALNAQMRAEILHATIQAGQSARVLIITGEGSAFCSGQDLGAGVNVSDIDMEGTLKDEYEPMVRAIYDARIPVIAAVNGPAVGAGCNLALAADVVIASEAAYFMQAFSKIGLIPDAGGTYWLPRKIGFARAMGATLFAEKIPAKQAAEWGMIWESVPKEEFAQHLAKRADQLAKGPTQAYSFTKRAMRMSFQQNLDAQLDTEAHFQGRASKTQDFKEGVLAFLSKRPAKFEGR